MSEHHRCRFRKESEKTFETFLPFASPWHKLRRIYRKLTVISLKHPRTQKFFKSNNAVNNERKRQIQDYSFFTIHPMSIFRKYWDILLFICLMYIMIAVPFVMVFFDDMTSKEWDLLILIDIIFCTGLYIEILLKFFTGYVRKDVMEVVLDKKSICKEYMKGMFFVDFIGSLPYAFIVSLANYEEDLNYVEHDEEVCNHILTQQKWRLISIFYLVNVFRYNQLNGYFDVIPSILNWSEKTGIFVKLTFNSFLFLHWMACFRLYFPGFIYTLNDSALYSAMHSSTDHHTVQDTVRSLMDRLNQLQTRDLYSNRTISEIYIRSFAVTTKISLSCGFGAETDDNDIEMAMTSLMIILGWIYFRYCFVTVMRMIVSTEASENQYEILYNEIEVYSRAKHVPAYLKEKIFLYYSNKYKHNYFNEELIISTLSKRLKDEILTHTCNTLITNVYLFNDLPQNLIQEIVKSLTLEIFLPHEVILAADTEGDSMFFMASGTAAVYSVMGKEICHLKDGDHFGEISLLEKGRKRTATIIALETCEIYKLEQKDFRRVVQPHTDLYERMQRVANDRMGKRSRQRESVRVMKSFLN